MPKNNETTTKFKVDISDLKKSMQDARKQVALANSEFKAVSSSLDDWSKSSDGISAKLTQLKSSLSAQEKVLAEYEKTLEKVKNEYGEGSKEALEYQTKLNNQKAVVNGLERQIRKYSDSLEQVVEAEKISAKTGKDVADVLEEMGKKAEDAEDGFTVLKGAVADFVGNVLTNLVDTLKDGISYMVTFADTADKAMNGFQASTGASAKEMEQFRDVMENIYNNNFGDSFEDIANSMSQVKQMAGDIGADELEKMTTNALMLRDTFGFEVNESMRAVNSLMDQFGISSENAFNLLAQGAQNGLNQNDDLLDTINEYSVQFENIGYSAEDMFNMLANGVDAGTWSVDKLGDAVKEFNIRMSDGSAKDAVEELGFSWDSVSAKWSEGGDSAKEVFNMLINELDGLETTTEGYNIGVGLLGTMYEDLGQSAVLALSETNGEITSSKNALDEINSVKYDTVGEAIGGIKRNLETGILMPISENILPKLSELSTEFNNWLSDPKVQEGITNLTTKLSEFIEKGLETFKELIDKGGEIKQLISDFSPLLATLGTALAGLALAGVIQNISSIGGAIKTAITSTQLWTAAQWLLNTAMNANPIGLVVIAIAALAAGFAVLWNKSETFRNFWIGLWENIKSTIGTAVENIGKFFTETIPQFIDKAVEFFQNLPYNIGYALGFVITKVIEWKNNMITKAVEVGTNFINKVVEYVKTLPEKIWTWLNNAISKLNQWKNDMGVKGKEAITELLNKIVEAAKSIPEKVKEIGKNIVDGVWQGICDAKDKFFENVKGFFSGIVDGAKDALGIHSPSKVFAKEVGKWIPEGIALGIDETSKSALQSMKDLTSSMLVTARNDMQGSVSGVGSTVNNFTQVINSPKSLTRLEIYRQSKNLLGYAGGV